MFSYFHPDPLGTDPGAYQTQMVDNCHFRDFKNHSYFGVPEFALEYIKYKGDINVIVLTTHRLVARELLALE